MLTFNPICSKFSGMSMNDELNEKIKNHTPTHTHTGCLRLQTDRIVFNAEKGLVKCQYKRKFVESSAQLLS